MNLSEQMKTPLADALDRHVQSSTVAFDVPGHKNSSTALSAYFGERCLSLDKNSREALDYLCRPTGVILEAEKLAADAFDAEYAFFCVDGTTGAIRSMIMYACAPGDKIILPRNVHVSVINAVILSGAIPVYIEPAIHPTLGISLGIKAEDVRDCIRRNTDAKAVLINNPTYYGICCDLPGIERIVHENGMLLLTDEAHGTHFYFHEKMPPPAMRAGADLSAVSMHKTGGSLTQSSLLLASRRVDTERMKRIMNLTETTSSSYLLIASLDIARKELAVSGHDLLEKVIRRVSRARKRVNETGGYIAFGEDIIDKETVYDFDPTKLSIHTSRIGLTGSEVYRLLRDRFDIQIEFGDVGNILAICTIYDHEESIDRLTDALALISKEYRKAPQSTAKPEFFPPLVRMSPRKAFFAEKEILPIRDAIGKISGDSVMCYPPGVPLLAPGEEITESIADHILYAEDKGCQVTGLVNGDDLCVVK